jgi:hypothetical protein
LDFSRFHSIKPEIYYGSQDSQRGKIDLVTKIHTSLTDFPRPLLPRFLSAATCPEEIYVVM